MVDPLFVLLIGVAINADIRDKGVWMHYPKYTYFP